MKKNSTVQAFRAKLESSSSEKIKSWLTGYYELEKFYIKHQHSITKNLDPELNEWSNEVRKDRKNKKLKKEQIHLLDLLRFDWSGSRKEPVASPFDLNLPFLCPTEKKECHIVHRSDGRKIRHYCVACSKSFTPLEEPLDFSDYTEDDAILFSETHRYDVWYTNFQKIKKFINRYGHSFPVVTDRTFGALGYYATRCRQQKRQGTLHPNKEKKLNAIGFDWEYRGSNVQKRRSRALSEKEFNSKQAIWNNMFQQLVEYKKIHGHSNVTQGEKGYKKLGKWVNEQRRLRNENRLPNHRVEILDNFKFIWNVPMYLYAEKVARYKKFFNKHQSWFLNPNIKITKWDKKVSNEIAQTICNGFGTYRTREKMNMMAEIGFPTNGDRGTPIQQTLSMNEYQKVKRWLDKGEKKSKIAEKLGYSISTFTKKLQQAESDFKK